MCIDSRAVAERVDGQAALGVLTRDHHGSTRSAVSKGDLLSKVAADGTGPVHHVEGSPGVRISIMRIPGIGGTLPSSSYARRTDGRSDSHGLERWLLYLKSWISRGQGYLNALNRTFTPM